MLASRAGSGDVNPLKCATVARMEVESWLSLERCAYKPGQVCDSTAVCACDFGLMGLIMGYGLDFGRDACVSHPNRTI